MVLGSDHLYHPFTSYPTEVPCRIKQIFVVNHQWIDETHLIQELIRNLVNQKYCTLIDIKFKKVFFQKHTNRLVQEKT